ncbi:MAG: hypothetical protein KAS19_13025, partial [Anaerolineales bacterium]|nr:hypothetical protein [Anaerolineales bacterium]
MTTITLWISSFGTVKWICLLRYSNSIAWPAGSNVTGSKTNSPAQLIKNLSSGISASLKTMLFCGCLIMALTGHQSLADDRLAERQHTGRW